MRSTASNIQMHGMTFENQTKGSRGIFRYTASDRKLSHNKRLDIAGSENQKLGYPTSIKSTVSNAIGLSDARGFW